MEPASKAQSQLLTAGMWPSAPVREAALEPAGEGQNQYDQQD
jgi:hypothetical protein